MVGAWGSHATCVMEPLVAPDIVDDPTRSAAAEPVRASITAQRRRRWGKHATLAAASLGAVGSFLAIERTIRGVKNGNRFDRSVMRAVGSVRSDAMTKLVRTVTFFGGVPGAIAVSLAATYAARRTPRAAAQIAVGALGGIVAELCIKRLFRRSRPNFLPHLEQVRSTSFPSGHSMASSSLYLTLAFVGSRGKRLRDHRAAVLGGAVALASAVGLTRVYLGVHWPTDVMGGLVLGTAWACLAEGAFDITGAQLVERKAGVAPTLATT
jgi:membrane-associated phospholipid phosphatase